MNIYSSITHKSQKVERTQMCINWWRDKNVNMDEMLFSHKKEWSPDRGYNMDKFENIMFKWKMTNIKGHILYVSIYMKCQIR